MKRLINVFIILLGFGLLMGLLIGLFFKVPYGNIAVLKLRGMIVSDGSNLFSQQVSVDSIRQQVEEINANPLIKSVIVDINSGGGSSVASAELVRLLKSLNKPSVALIRDLGASGAYWAASACDVVIAHELSLVGSIGVNMNYLEYSGLMRDFNVSYINLSYPEHKDMFSIYRPLSEQEHEWAMEWLEYAYDYFMSDVALNRNMTLDELAPFANGSLFMGYQALDYGLVDELGGWEEAYNKSIELGNVTEPVLLTYEEGTSIFDLLSGIMGKKDVSLKT